MKDGSSQMNLQHSPEKIEALVVVKVKKKLSTDPDTKCMTVHEWLLTQSLSNYLQQMSIYCVTRGARAGLLVPYLDYDGNGLLITWATDEEPGQRRIFYMKIEEGKRARYQCSTGPVENGDFTWKFITDSDLTNATILEVANYMLAGQRKKKAS